MIKALPLWDSDHHQEEQGLDKGGIIRLRASEGEARRNASSSDNEEGLQPLHLETGATFTVEGSDYLYRIEGLQSTVEGSDEGIRFSSGIVVTKERHGAWRVAGRLD